MPHEATRPMQGTLFDVSPDKPDAHQLLPLDQYDVIAVGYSGGKDSLAALLDLLERGVPPSKIELHHHDIDGQGEKLMDWPCTHAYVKATAEAREMPREAAIASMASSGLPSRTVRSSMCFADVLSKSSQSCKIIVSPRQVSRRFRRKLRAWMARVAQTQLSGL